MLALIERSHAADAAYTVASVIADRADAGGLVVARQRGIEAAALPRPPGSDRAGYDRLLAAAIAKHSPALVVLAGFMRILSAEFIARFAGRILNIHPSLLPKYAGLHTHRRALEAHEAEHGVTVHFVTEQLDGGPPVLQARVPILPGDDGKDTERTRADSGTHHLSAGRPLVLPGTVALRSRSCASRWPPVERTCAA